MLFDVKTWVLITKNAILIIIDIFQSKSIKISAFKSGRIFDVSPILMNITILGFWGYLSSPESLNQVLRQMRIKDMGSIMRISGVNSNNEVEPLRNRKLYIEISCQN